MSAAAAAPDGARTHGSWILTANILTHRQFSIHPVAEMETEWLE